MLIRTVDTEVVVLAVFAINNQPAVGELWLAFGTGKSFRYLAAHQIAACLGLEMPCALPMFRALMLADGPRKIPNHAINIIVILLFDITKLSHDQDVLIE